VGISKELNQSYQQCKKEEEPLPSIWSCNIPLGNIWHGGVPSANASTSSRVLLSMELSGAEEETLKHRTLLLSESSRMYYTP